MPSIAYGRLVRSSKITLSYYGLVKLLTKWLFLIIFGMLIVKLFSNAAGLTSHDANKFKTSFKKLKRKEKVTETQK